MIILIKWRLPFNLNKQKVKKKKKGLCLAHFYKLVIFTQITFYKLVIFTDKTPCPDLGTGAPHGAPLLEGCLSGAPIFIPVPKPGQGARSYIYSVTAATKLGKTQETPDGRWWRAGERKWCLFFVFLFYFYFYLLFIWACYILFYFI